MPSINKLNFLITHNIPYESAIFEQLRKVFKSTPHYSPIQKAFYDLTSTKDDLFEKEKNCLTYQSGNRGNKNYTHFSAKNPLRNVYYKNYKNT